MKIKSLAFLSSCTVLAIASSVILSLSEKVSTAQTTIPDVYKKALIDAAEPEPEEVLDKLTVINESNPKIWEGEPGKSRVLVATFSTKNRHKIGQQTLLPIKPKNSGRIDLTEINPIWVTVISELQDFCKQYKKNIEVTNDPLVTKEILNERLEQVLGLPPKSGYTDIATIAVDRKYLRRTTPNSDISTYQKQSLTDSIFISNSKQPNLRFSDGVNSIYKDWFTALFNNRNSSKYPWTGLGYTYDWTPKTNLQNDNDAGLSEFVIFPNSEASTPYEVKQVLPTEQYCQAK